MKHVEILLVSLPKVLTKVLVLELKLQDDYLDDPTGLVNDRKGVARRFA